MTTPRFLVGPNTSGRHPYQSIPCPKANYWKVLRIIHRMIEPSFSRRNFLRGAGALLALPWLESIGKVSAFAAEAGVRPPMRLGIFTVTGGTVLESWKLPQAGSLLGHVKLPSILRPLDFAREELLILTGLAQDGRSENVNAHEHCAFTHLTGADAVKREGGKPISSVSVDQLVASKVGHESILPSLEFGLAGGENVYSFAPDGQPVPYEDDPRLVFDRMFRGRQPVVPNWSRRAQNQSAASQPGLPGQPSYDRSVIDLVLDDAKSVQRKLGKADQRRLDEYLAAIRAVEKRIDLMEGRQRIDLLDAANPGPSKLSVPEISRLDLFKNKEKVRRDPERHGEYISLMAELMVLAFQTDTTRVCTFACGSDEAMFPGVVTVGYERHCHTLEHQGNAGRVEDADPISREACRQIHAWYTQLFAECIRRMKQIDEGGSTLLDNTMMLYTSYMADGGHGRNDYPCLLVGNAQGTLQTGRQIDFQKDTPVANLYLELMSRMGLSEPQFGNSHTSKNAAYNGKLPGLA